MFFSPSLNHFVGTYNLPIRYVFGVGVLIAAICVVLALYAEDIPYYIHELLKKREDSKPNERGANEISDPHSTTPNSRALHHRSNAGSSSDATDTHHGSYLRRRRSDDLESGTA